MRRGLAMLVWPAAAFAAACAPSLPAENWTCDFDANVARPLADQDAKPDEGGRLPSGECQTTCGPPASACTWTALDGGRAGAVCPVCTF